MESSRFDNMAKLFALRRSRRATISTGAAGVALAIGANRGRAAAQQSTPSASPVPSAPVSFLFVQTYDGGTIAPLAGAPGMYLLTLTNALGPTVAFSDRPARRTETLPTERLGNLLDFPAADPPNAALVARIGDAEEAVLIVELLAPTYDPVARTATYQARALHDYGDFGPDLATRARPIEQMPAAFGLASLFIDDSSDAGAAGCGYAQQFCSSNSSCCTGYNCVTVTCAPNDQSQTSVISYTSNVCQPAPN